MPRTSAEVILLNTIVVAAASGTKGAPGAITQGGYYDNQANYDSPLGIFIKNGAIGPGVPLSVVIQVASDKDGPWTDFEVVAGDILAYVAGTLAGVTSKTILLPKVRYVRAFAYGNTSQDVEVKITLHAVTGL